MDWCKFSYIVHPESFRSNTQNANAFARRNRPRVKRNGGFICVRVRLRLRSFASTVRVRPHALTCVRTRLRTYIYTQLGPGLVPDPAVPPQRAGSSPIVSSVPAPIGVPPARLRHQPGCTRLARRPTGRDQLDPPLRESSRQINKLHVVRPFVCANCVRVYRYTSVRTRAHKRSFFMRLRACLRAELIKTQNAFARKIFQHANALWVQKLSGCTVFRMMPRRTKIKSMKSFTF